MIKFLTILHNIRRRLFQLRILKRGRGTTGISGELADGRKVIIIWEVHPDIPIQNDYPINAYVKMYTKSSEAMNE